MDGYELFCQLSFGTSFDPKQPKHRKNKLKNYKRNKRKRFEENTDLTDSKLEKKETAVIKNENLSDFSDESLSDEEVEKVKNMEAEKEEKVTLAKEKKKKRLSAMQMFKIRKEEVSHFRRVNKIYVIGDDIPDPIETFNQLVTDYEMDSCILNNVNKLEYLSPTPIQMQAIPLMLHGRQILACAPTGSGKTAAFLIPLVHNLKTSKKGGLRAVILAPTRELAKQIQTFCLLLSEGSGLRILTFEDVNAAKKKPNFLRKHDILISTPNRIIYLLQSDPPILNLNRVQWLVIDECDKLFEAGKDSFRDQLAVIYKACDPVATKKAMFSATYCQDVEEWCRLNLDGFASLTVGLKNTAVEAIKQELLFVGSEGGKLLAVRNLLKEGFMPPVMIFVQSKERAKELYSELQYENFKIDVMHSNLEQSQRDKVIEKFSCGKTWILICTDVMARGIDFKGINLVINYDIPPTAISYIHRIGRTGRAGETGKAVTYFTTDDVINLRNIAQVMKNAGCDVPDYIMKLKKAPKKKKGEPVRPIKRQKISTVPKYDIEKEQKKKKFVQNSIKKKLKKA